MDKYLIVIGMMLVLLTVGLSGCLESPEPPSINLFTAVNPDQNANETTYVLFWNVTGATSVSIDNGIGSVNHTGSIIVNPTKTTTYILTATNSASTSTESTQAIVTGS